MNSIVQETAGGPRGGGLKAKRAKEKRTGRAAGFSRVSGAAAKRGEKGDAGRAGAASSRHNGQCTSDGGDSCPSGKSAETGAALAVLSGAIQRVPVPALVQTSAHAGPLLRVNASA